MTDIRALAKTFVKEEISHFGGAVPIRTKGSRLYETQVTKLVRDRAELARAVLRLLEAGEGARNKLNDCVYYEDDGKERAWNKEIATLVAAWDTAVRGEEGG